MSDLSNQTPADTYKGLLQVNDYTDGVDATAKYIQDGEGTDSALAISTANVGIGTTNPGAKLHVDENDSVPLYINRRTSEGDLLQFRKDGSAVGSIGVDFGDNLTIDAGSGESGLNFATSQLAPYRGGANADAAIDLGLSSVRWRDLYLSGKTHYGVSGQTYYQVVKSNGDGLYLGADEGNTGGNGADIRFNVKADEKMRIDSDGNVGIGTTAPSEKLHVSGNAIITGDLSVSGTTTTVNTQTLSVEDHQVILGTLASGTPTDLTADDGGIVLKGDTDKTILWSNDTDAWRCNQNFIADGNVGIGTTDPGAELEVNGQIISNRRFMSEDSLELVSDYNDNSSTSIISFKIDGQGAGNEKMRIDSDGNVGIGTTSPSDLLHIVKSNDSSVGINIDNSNAGANAHARLALKNDSDDTFYLINNGSGRTSTTRYGITIADYSEILAQESINGLLIGTGLTNTPIIFGNNNTERMRIAAGGNVGIGTTSPAVRLHCETNAQSVARFESTSTSAGAVAHIAIQSPSASGLGKARIGSDGDDLYFSTLDGVTPSTEVSIERMRINSAGNVGIGTTSPDPNVLLHVQGKVGTTNGEEADPTHTFYSDPDTGMFRAAVDTLAFSTGGVEKMRIDSNGNVGIGTTSPDAKLEVKSVSNLHMRVGNTDQETSPIIRFQGQSSGGQNHYADIQLDAETGTLLLKDPGTSAPSIGQNPVAIDSNGNVGIGTTSPTGGKLHIIGGNHYSEGICLSGRKNDNTDLTTLRFFHDDNDYAHIARGADECISISSAGNVGIGTASPDAPLHILTSNTTDTLLLEATSDVGLNAPDLTLYRNSASPAVDDKIGVVKFRGKHSGGGTKDYANIQGIIVDPTNTSEDSKIAFEVRTGGTLESRMEVGPDKVEVSSTTGGVVMPRMTTTQRNAIASPINGEMVYDTDLNKFYGYANNAWTPLH